MVSPHLQPPTYSCIVCKVWFENGFFVFGGVFEDSFLSRNSYENELCRHPSLFRSILSSGKQPLVASPATNKPLVESAIIQMVGASKLASKLSLIVTK